MMRNQGRRERLLQAALHYIQLFLIFFSFFSFLFLLLSALINAPHPATQQGPLTAHYTYISAQVLLRGAGGGGGGGVGVGVVVCILSDI